MMNARHNDRSAVEGHATDGDFIFALVVQKELQQSQLLTHGDRQSICCLSANIRKVREFAQSDGNEH
jgi:hypothetical protein